ncbi:MAG: carbohydrate kinase family protein [Candidatus Falkowbacteria bacterium]|nr:carbohydrate kinase family protein [Candidatus Falkowbacteria bacterium]
MLRKYDFITIGGATEDIFFTVDDYLMLNDQKLHERVVGFEYGSKVGIKDMHYSFGGGASNTAIALAKLGFKVAAVVSVGDDDAGQRMINNLLKHKVDCRFVQREAGKSGRSLVLKTASGDHVLFTYRASNGLLKINHKLSKKLENAKRLYLTSLSGAWREILKEVFSTKTKIAWNPGRKQLAVGYNGLKNFLALTDILILNKDEAVELLMPLTKKVLPVSMMLKKLYKSGPKIVIITEGRRGASVFDGKKIYKEKATTHKAIDTTGVGDAFGSTFVAAFDYHNNISRALKLAMKNSGSVVTKLGAQNGLLSREKIGF